MPIVRRPQFEYPASFVPQWTPRVPELAAVANAVSMAMPHVEPLVVASVRNQLDGLSADLKIRAQAFAHQEASHHAQHFRFNKILIGHYPTLRLIDRALAAMYRFISRRSEQVQSAFVAAFEVLAFCVASWMSNRADLLMRDADPTASRLFLWHLGEEVEHRGIAHDVFRESGGKRRTYVLGLILAVALLGIGTFAAAVTVLASDRRLWRPIALGRLVSWGISFLWLAMPLCWLSVFRHPKDFKVPDGVLRWADDPVLVEAL